MSLHFLETFNSPALVTATGTAIVLGIPTLELSTVSLAALKGANAVAFLVNVIAVSIPGRLDGQEQQSMQHGSLTTENDKTTKKQEQQDNPYFSIRTRTLVNPAPYAFAIWGPIYLGEAVFVTSQLVASSESSIASSSILSLITGPWCAANLTQSLWCAAFRPCYNNGWRKYISAGLLAATAYSLDKVHAITSSSTGNMMYVPLAMHFGWMTAATLVNVNGSLAMSSNVSDSMLCIVGHASILVASIFGVTTTLVRASPTFGLVIAWALLACAKGMTQKLDDKKSKYVTFNKSNTLKKGAKRQRVLCWMGTAACLGASAFVVAKL